MRHPSLFRGTVLQRDACDVVHDKWLTASNDSRTSIWSRCRILNSNSARPSPDQAGWSARIACRDPIQGRNTLMPRHGSRVVCRICCTGLSEALPPRDIVPDRVQHARDRSTPNRDLAGPGGRRVRQNGKKFACKLSERMSNNIRTWATKHRNTSAPDR